MINMRIGVVIARMQTPYLTEGHHELIRYADARNISLIIMLGTSQAKLTTSNPMNFETRKIMVQESYPNAFILPLPDHSSDQQWSYNVDELLAKNISPYHAANIELYGGRDSFIKYYTGIHRTHEMQSPNSHVSATLLRNAVSKMPLDTVDFRKGIIYAAYDRYPTAYPCMDAVISKANGEFILLCTKSKFDKLQFIGGFFDVLQDRCLEDTVRREVTEETTLRITDPKYLGSLLVDDWRYRNTRDKIVSMVYHAQYVGGIPTPSDDLVNGTLDWYRVDDLTDEHFAEVHQPIFDMYRTICQLK